MSLPQQFADATAKALGEAQDWHQQGMKTIIRNHPEWASEPPESFIDLLKSPDNQYGIVPGEGAALLLLDGESQAGVNVEIVAVLGTAELKVSQILQLGRGAVVELERGAEDNIDLIADGRLVARGQVVVVEDKLAVQISEVVRQIISK